MPREIDREEVQRLIEAGAQLVEVLPGSEFEEDHLPGAINVPLSKIAAGVDQLIDRARPIIVYCWDTA